MYELQVLLQKLWIHVCYPGFATLVVEPRWNHYTLLRSRDTPLDIMIKLWYPSFLCDIFACFCYRGCKNSCKSHGIFCNFCNSRMSLGSSKMVTWFATRRNDTGGKYGTSLSVANIFCSIRVEPCSCCNAIRIVVLLLLKNKYYFHDAIDTSCILSTYFIFITFYALNYAKGTSIWQRHKIMVSDWCPKTQIKIDNAMPKFY